MERKKERKTEGRARGLEASKYDYLDGSSCIIAFIDNSLLYVHVFPACSMDEIAKCVVSYFR